MGEDKGKETAGSVLDRIAGVLAESEIDHSKREDDGEGQFLGRAMAIVNEWRRDRLLEQGKAKNRRFQEFITSALNSLHRQRESGSGEKVLHVKPALAVAFYRRFETITANDLESARVNEELLKLWTEFGDTEEASE